MAPPFMMGAPFPPTKPATPPPYDPLSNPSLSALYQSTSTLVLPWPPTAYDPAHLSHPDMDVRVAPTNGAILNGLQTYRFGSSTTRLRSGDFIQNYGVNTYGVGGNGYGLSVLVNIVTGSVTSDLGLNNLSILTDSDLSYWSLQLRRSSGQLQVGILHNVIPAKVAWADCPEGEWVAIYAGWDGTTLYVDAGLGVGSIASDRPASVVNDLEFGANVNGTQLSAQMDLADVMFVYNYVDLVRSDYLSYVNDRYDLALT